LSSFGGKTSIDPQLFGCHNPVAIMKEFYVSVDIEAAGPVPAIYSMLSLGAAAVDDLSINFYAELKPINRKSIPDAMKVVGRTLADFANTGRDPKETMSAFTDWLHTIAGNRKLVFVGFNAAFDWAFVNYYFQRYLHKNPFGYGAIDIKSYYMGLSGSTWEDTRSSRIPSELKGKTRHTHNALNDAIEQAEIFSKMMRQAVRLKR
jgi:DNA polymerase III epsilon subunit-like protein